MKPMSLEDKLAVNKFDLDRDVHIQIREEICEKCESHACLYACPSDCFKLTDEHITFSYEGCLECGSCKIICDEAIDWTLPRGGLGICYQYG